LRGCVGFEGSQRKDGNVHRLGAEQRDRFAGQGKSRLPRRPGRELRYLGDEDPVRRMMHTPLEKPACRVGGKKQVAFDQKKRERTRPGGRGAGSGSPGVFANRRACRAALRTEKKSLRRESPTSFSRENTGGETSSSRETPRPAGCSPESKTKRPDGPPRQKRRSAR